MSAASEYTKAIDTLGEKQDEYDFIRAAHESLIGGHDGSMSTAEYGRRFKAANRLLDAAWKASFDAARLKDAAMLRLMESPVE